MELLSESHQTSLCTVLPLIWAHCSMLASSFIFEDVRHYSFFDSAPSLVPNCLLYPIVPRHVLFSACATLHNVQSPVAFAEAGRNLSERLRQDLNLKHGLSSDTHLTGCCNSCQSYWAEGQHRAYFSPFNAFYSYLFMLCP